METNIIMDSNLSRICQLFLSYISQLDDQLLSGDSSPCPLPKLIKGAPLNIKTQFGLALSFSRPCSTPQKSP